MIAEAAVGVVGADDAECAEVEFFQQLGREDAGQQIPGVVEVADNPAEVGVVNVLGVGFVHALIKST